jgi:hypothetical protein
MGGACRIVILALITTGVPLSAAGRTPAARSPQAEGAGRVSGTAKEAKGGVLPRYRARIRNVTNGQISGETRTDDKGGFVFTGLNPGTYVVEFVSADGIVVGTSASISLTVGSMVATGLTVTASAAAAGAATGAAGALGAATGGGGVFGSNAGVLVLTAAAAAGIRTVVVVTSNASPSR